MQSSIFEEWMKLPAESERFEATSLILRLIQLVAGDVCTFRHNTQASYRFVDTARAAYDEIHGLIKNVDNSTDWTTDFETYTNAIEPLENILIQFQLAQELGQDSHLHDAVSATNFKAFIDGWETSRKTIRDSLKSLRDEPLFSTFTGLKSESDDEINAAYKYDDCMHLGDLVVAIKAFCDNTTKLGAFPGKVKKIFHELHKGTQHVKALLSSPPLPDVTSETSALAVKSAMAIYGAMELALSVQASADAAAAETKLKTLLKSEKLWMEAKHLTSSVIKAIGAADKYDAAKTQYEKFMDMILKVAGSAAPEWLHLVKLISKIGRAYHAQSLVIVHLCRKAATQYNQSPNDLHYVALEDTFEKAAAALTAATNLLKPTTDAAAFFNVESYADTSDCNTYFKESADLLIQCFTDMNIPTDETIENQITAAKKKDKDRMVAANTRKTKSPSIEADEAKLVSVTVEVRKDAKLEGPAVATYTCKVPLATRLAAIAYGASRDSKLKLILKERELELHNGTNGSVALHNTIQSQVPTGNALTLIAVEATKPALEAWDSDPAAKAASSATPDAQTAQAGTGGGD